MMGTKPLKKAVGKQQRLPLAWGCFYHYNAHGDVIALTDAQGNVVARYEYDTWGQLLSQSGEMADENHIVMPDTSMTKKQVYIT